MSVEITLTHESAIQLKNGHEVLRAATRKGRGLEPAEVGVVLARIVSPSAAAGRQVEYAVWSMARPAGKDTFDTFHGDYQSDEAEAVRIFHRRVERDVLS